MSGNVINPVSVPSLQAASPRASGNEVSAATVRNPPAQSGGRVTQLTSSHSQVSTAVDGAAFNDQLASAVSEVTNYVQNISRDLNFSVDEDLGKTIIKVIDSESEEVIRQIPAKEIIQVAKALREYLDSNESATSEGLLIKTQA